MPILRQLGGLFYNIDGGDSAPTPSISARDPVQLRVSATATLETINQLQRIIEPPCGLTLCCGSCAASYLKPSRLAMLVAYGHLISSLFLFLTICGAELAAVELFRETVLSEEGMNLAILPTALATALAAGWFICGLREKRLSNFYPFLLVQHLIVVVCILLIVYSMVKATLSNDPANQPDSPVLFVVLLMPTAVASAEVLCIYLVVRAMRTLKLRIICAGLVARHLAMASGPSGRDAQRHLQEYRLRHGLPPPPPSYEETPAARGRRTTFGGLSPMAGRRSPSMPATMRRQHPSLPSMSHSRHEHVAHAGARAAAALDRSASASTSTLDSNWASVPPAENSAAPPAYAHDDRTYVNVACERELSHVEDETDLYVDRNGPIYRELMREVDHANAQSPSDSNGA